MIVTLDQDLSKCLEHIFFCFFGCSPNLIVANHFLEILSHFYLKKTFEISYFFLLCLLYYTEARKMVRKKKHCVVMFLCAYSALWNPFSPNPIELGPPCTQFLISKATFLFFFSPITGMTALQTHVTISPTIILFQTHPHLKPLVKISVERAVQEWIGPVVDRSIKIALQTCEHIIRKDFALDSEENRMRLAAHYMVRYLTAGMAMITCRDQLLTSIGTYMKQQLQSALGAASGQHKDVIEQAATIVAQDNMELACAFIQKTATEKAIPEIDKRLMNEYELRKVARQEGRLVLLCS